MLQSSSCTNSTRNMINTPWHKLNVTFLILWDRYQTDWLNTAKVFQFFYVCIHWWFIEWCYWNFFNISELLMTIFGWGGCWCKIVTTSCAITISCWYFHPGKSVDNNGISFLLWLIVRNNWMYVNCLWDMINSKTFMMQEANLVFMIVFFVMFQHMVWNPL